MMRPVPWSQRELSFGRGLDELPVLMERARGTPHRLRALLQHRSPEALSLRLSGTWSVMEHLGHLIVLQDRFEERVTDFELRRTRLCVIDLSDQERMLAGQRVRSLGDVLEELHLKRKAFLRRVERLSRASLLHVASHPCKDRPMRPMDMLLWIAEHDDHHLATMRGLLSGPEEERT